MFKIWGNIERIEEVKQRIIYDFNNECVNGQQSKELDNGYLACGQFMGERTRKINQKGIHGTASAIRVLAESKKTDTLQGLIRYVHDKTSIKDKESIDNNIIKLSELLYAIECIQLGEVDKMGLPQKLSESLINAKTEDGRGWDFFIDTNDSEPEIIPTAYAVMALSVYGCKNGKLNEPISFLKNEIRKDIKSENKTRVEDFSVYILCLYVLVFLKEDLEKDEKKFYKSALKKYWNSLKNLMTEDLEQNIEYWHRNENKYVRIPWQLYLIPIAAKLKPYKIFSSNTIHDRFDSIINKVLGEGFIYPHSGSDLSTRTNAILFDSLSKIKRVIRYNPLMNLFYIIDRARSIMGHRILSYFFSIGAVIFVIIAIIDWKKSGTGSIGEIIPDLIAAIIIMLLTTRKHN